MAVEDVKISLVDDSNLIASKERLRWEPVALAVSVATAFHRGQMLFKDASNMYKTTYASGDTFVGIIVNDVAEMQPSQTINTDVYTDGDFVWKKIYDLQDATVQALIPQPMLYEKTINLVMCH